MGRLTLDFARGSTFLSPNLPDPNYRILPPQNNTVTVYKDTMRPISHTTNYNTIQFTEL